jgi:phage shock protein E
MKMFATVLLTVALGCGGPPPGVKTISADELLGNTLDDVLILDVRSSKEFSSGHVPNAINMPHDEVSFRLAELGSSTARPVVVYCERGGRAGKAEAVLLGAGYQQVFHLAGDMSDWRSKGRPTE